MPWAGSGTLASLEHLDEARLPATPEAVARIVEEARLAGL